MGRVQGFHTRVAGRLVRNMGQIESVAGRYRPAGAPASA